MGGGRGAGADGGEGDVMVVLQLQVKDPTFDLAKAVCSHGLFMMAPNRWDPATASLGRPLRLFSSSASFPVRVSQPSPPPDPLLVSVSGTTSLSAQDQHAILAQVRRMLRISDENDMMIGEFHRIHVDAKERGFGRIFRSPTLFEDMVKCILLCNCQWPRTLSMAKALCELQQELRCCTKSLGFHPKTPQSRGRKRKRQNIVNVKIRQLSAGMDADGDFPSPEELVSIDVDYLASRCKLGYRAKRIVSLARDIVEHKIQFSKLEKVCDRSTPLSIYDELDKELSCLCGFGPFTRANVLMCMGFYHRIPSDSETSRHLKQFHAKESCKDGAMEKSLEAIYGKYAPFQFLAYWFELWAYYEETFGKMTEMPPSDYNLITANNMKCKVSKIKR